MALDWLPTAPSEYPKRRTLPAAIQAGSFFFIRYFPVLETVTPDKWLGTYPEQIRRTPVRPRQEISFIPYYGERPVTMDQWEPHVPWSQYKKQRAPDFIPGSTLAWTPIPITEVPLIPSWTPVYPDLLLTKPGLMLSIQSGFHFWFPYDLDPPWPSKWETTYPSQIIRIPQLPVALQQAGLIQVDIPVETISLDKWLPQYIDFIFRKPFPMLQELSWAPITITPDVSADMFLGEFPVQILRNPKVLAAIAAGYLFYQEKPPYPASTLYVWRRIA